MGRNYPEFLQSECDRLRRVVWIQQLAIGFLTLIAFCSILTNNYFLTNAAY
ncbi:MAG: hypothetical protein ACRC2S_28425 [Waterburya sp.]